MEHVESTTTAESVMDGMVIENEENVSAGEVPAEVVAENLLEGEQQEETTQTEEADAAQAETQEEADAAQAIRDGVNSLFAQGWSGDELMVFSQDEQVRRDIAEGKSVAEAAMAYLRRALAGALKGDAQQPAAAQKQKKRGVPTITRGAAANVREAMTVDDMDDEAFAKFSKRAQDLAKEGKKVLIK